MTNLIVDDDDNESMMIIQTLRCRVIIVIIIHKIHGNTSLQTKRQGRRMSAFRPNLAFASWTASIGEYRWTM